MEDVIKRIKEIRKEKGISHEAMAFDLGISQVAYSKIEKNETKLTLERLYKIADILESKISEILGLEIQKVYQQEFNDNSQNYQEIQHLHQENKEVYEKLISAKDDQISLLKEQLVFMKEQLKR
jgi:transcriptional regulator with XRE-family HTH domain